MKRYVYIPQYGMCESNEGDWIKLSDLTPPLTREEAEGKVENLLRQFNRSNHNDSGSLFCVAKAELVAPLMHHIGEVNGMVEGEE